MRSKWRSRFGFAQHINNNAERLRYQFVNHSSKKELKVAVEKLTNNQDWQQAVELWSKQIDDNVKADIADLMVCDFSTTTPIIRTASQVVMMDALKQYAGLSTICNLRYPASLFYGEALMIGRRFGNVWEL